MFEGVVEWIRANAVPWAYVAVVVGATTDSVLFLGLVFPNETMLLLGGFLAWRDVVSFPVVVAAAVGGGVLGDSIAYEAGRRLGPRIEHSRLGVRVGRHRWDRGRRFLRRRHAPAIFFARYATGVRAVVPFLAGHTRLRYRRFLLWNVLGAITWGSVFVGLGYAAGPSYEQLEAWVGRAGALLGLVVVTVVVVVLIRTRRRGDREDQPVDEASVG